MKTKQREKRLCKSLAALLLALVLVCALQLAVLAGGEPQEMATTSLSDIVPHSGSGLAGEDTGADASETPPAPPEDVAPRGGELPAGPDALGDLEAGSWAQLVAAIDEIRGRPGRTGSIDLTGDIVMEEVIQLSTSGADEHWNVTIDGGGHTLTSANGRHFAANADTLVLINCVLDGGGSEGGISMGGQYASSEGLLRMEGCVIQNIRTAANGGGIYITSTAELVDTSIRDCYLTTSASYGAGISLGAIATVNLRGNTSVTGCGSEGSNVVGGAIAVGGGKLYLYDESSISNNGHLGVYIHSSGFTLHMQDQASISGNLAGGVYAGAYGTVNMSGEAHISDNQTTALQNMTSAGGLAMAATTGTSTVTMRGNSHISGNVSSHTNNEAAGGVLLRNANMTMSDHAHISANYSANRAGGVMVQYSRLTMQQYTKMDGNTAANFGGAVYVLDQASKTSINDYSALMLLHAASITNNTAINYDGGGVYLHGIAHSVSPTYATTAVVDIRGVSCAVTGNTAGRNGGGIYSFYNTNSVYHILGSVFLIPDSQNGIAFRDNYAAGGIKTTPHVELQDDYDRWARSTSVPAAFTTHVVNNYDIGYFGGAPIANTVDVEYWVNGARHSREVVARGALATEPTVSLDPGEILYGWYQDPGFAPGSKWDFSNFVNSDLVLYAYTEAPAAQYDVLFYKNDGTTDLYHTQANVAVGDPVPRPDGEPALYGHTFDDWYTQKTGGSVWAFATQPMPDGPLSLYAQYLPNAHRVTFHYNYEGKTREYRIDFGETLPQPNDTQRSGYTFGGWMCEGVLWDFTTTMPDRALDLYAVWTPVGSSSQSSSGGGSSNPGPGPEPSSSSTGGSSTGGPRVPSSSSGSSSPVTSAVSPAPVGSSSSAPLASSSFALPPEEQNLATLRLFGLELPLGLGETGGWSILNLLVSLICLGCAAFALVRALLRRRRHLGNMQDLEDKQTPAPYGLRVGRWLSIATGALLLPLFFLLENLAMPAMLLSRWTPLFVCLALLQAASGAVAALLGRRRVSGPPQ